MSGAGAIATARHAVSPRRRFLRPARLQLSLHSPAARRTEALHCGRPKHRVLASRPLPLGKTGFSADKAPGPRLQVTVPVGLDCGLAVIAVEVGKLRASTLMRLRTDTSGRCREAAMGSAAISEEGCNDECS